MLKKTMVKAEKKQEDNTEKNKLKKIYNIVSTVLLTVIFLFLIFVIVVAIVQKKGGGDVKLLGKYYLYTVVTESMEPTIMAGDVILSRAATEADIKEGAVITFIAPSGVLKGYNETHRITSIERDESGIITGIKTKGDNSIGADNWTIQPSDVKAVFVKDLAVMSAFRGFMSKPIGFIVVIVLPLLLVMVLFMIGFVKDKAKLDQEEKIKENEIKVKSIDELTDEQKKELAEQILLEHAAEVQQSQKENKEDEKKTL